MLVMMFNCGGTTDDELCSDTVDRNNRDGVHERRELLNLYFYYFNLHFVIPNSNNPVND